MASIELETEGMHCPSCEMLVVDALEELDCVKSAKANHKDGKVIIEGSVDKLKAIQVIKAEGYKVRK